MLNLILKFVSSARAAGLRISTSETRDCLIQMQHVDPLNESQFSRVLRANFAKSHRDQEKFDRLYHLFFHELRDNENLSGATPIAEYKQKILEQIALEKDSQNPMPAIIDFLDGNPADYLQMLQHIENGGADPSQASGSNMGAMLNRLGIMLSLNRARRSVADFLALHRNRIYWEDRESIAAHFNRRLDSALGLLTSYRSTAAKARPKRRSYDRRLRQLGETAFTSLTRKEVVEMRDAIRELVRKLKDVISRRYAVRTRGCLDIKKTLRRASKYQGIPMEVVFRRKPPMRGKIVVLCDVSGSVWSSARFMLNMLYSLQECFTKVRTFVFVSGLDEVTRLFDNHDIDQAINRVMNDADIDYETSTDYGRTLREFQTSYMDILNKKTTLIVIGDGRSNYTNPEAGILYEMRERSRRLIWLNPETEMFWYSGDSEMRTYETCCTQVRPCGNLNQLTEFIRELVL